MDDINIFDFVREAMEFIDENEEKINGLLDKGSSISITEQEPLKDIHKGDDEVILTIETKEDVENIRYEKLDEGVLLEINNKNVRAELPDDAQVGMSSATLNNGVLEVKIPRENDGDR